MRESAMNVFPDLQIHNKIMLKNKNSQIGVSTINSAHFKVSINSGFLENLTYSNWILHQISRITYFLLNMSSFYFILCNSFHPTWVAGTSRLVGKSSFPWPATGHVITGQLIQDGGALFTGPAVTTSQLIQDGGTLSTCQVITSQLIQDGGTLSTCQVITSQLIQDGATLFTGHVIITCQLIQDGGALTTGHVITSQLIQDGATLFTDHVIITSQLIQDGGARSAGHVITRQLIQDGGARSTGHVIAGQLIQDGGARSTGHVIAGQLIQDGDARSTGHVIACQLIQDGVALSVGAGQNIGVIHRSCPQDKVRLSRPIDHFNNIINMNINVKQIKD